MPHSSGGGSSHGGSHGSSRSKSSDMRYGNRFYRGANRYVFYRNGRPQYYFSEQPFTLETAKKEKFRMFFSGILSAILGVILAFAGFNSLPQRVKTDYNTEILINDSAGLVSSAEEEEMKNAFQSFQDKTGVTPAFFTIDIEELKAKGGNLHNYAYNLYVNTFDDEKHWLVVYCRDNVENSWSWEGMIGDDCGSIISTDLENEFTKQLQTNLKSGVKTLSASVTGAFDQVGQKSGKVPSNKLSMLILGFGGGAFELFLAGKQFVKATKNKPEDDPRLNAVQCPEAEAEPATVKCEYCDGEFVVGLHTACPHCGAPLEEKWE